jgi:transposase
MSCEVLELPSDAQEIVALLTEKDREIARLTRETERQQARLQALQEQFNLLIAKRFGRSSEKRSADQLWLFNEAEATAPCDPEPEAVISVPAHRRVRPGRKPLPAALPRIEVIHELPAEERICTHDGEALVEIGEEISEQLDIVPAQVRVLRHVRKKYACPHCQLGVKTAPLPPQPLPKTMASPGLLAHIAVAKYQDALPLHRQEHILKRIGLDLPRATLAAWMIKLGIWIQPLINLLQDVLLGYDVLQMDETTLQVLKEPAKLPQSNSYLWVRRGGPPDLPVLLFDYDPSRSQAVPLRLLEGYRGYVQVDGYDGYNAVGLRSDIVLVGCMAHARRKFDEAVKAQGVDRDNPEKIGKAMEGLRYLQALYRIERECKGSFSEERYSVRQQKAKPLFETLRAWLDAALPTVAPQSMTGKALTYLRNQWPKLIRYLDDGRLSIDNNRVENAIRPFVIGRRNWLFSDTVRGAQSSANLYSLIETAKANGLEPYAYLRHLFTELPKAQTLEQIEALLPFHAKTQQLTPTPPEQ